MGSYKNDLREGKGVYTYEDGRSYDGDWKNDKREGKGVFKFANGGSYDGYWKNDNMEGKGVFTFANGGSYLGTYKNDKKEGKGVRTFAVNGSTTEAGDSHKINAGDVCDCEWKDDKRNGACRYTFFNGEVYACMFVEGRCPEFDQRQAAVRADPKAFKFASDSMVRFL